MPRPIKERRISKNFEVVWTAGYRNDYWLSLDSSMVISDKQQAYELALEKWSLLASGQYYLLQDGGTYSCGFCIYYSSCIDCPLWRKRVHRGCSETPYAVYYDAIDRGDQKTAVAAAQAMLKFLQGLSEQ